MRTIQEDIRAFAPGNEEEASSRDAIISALDSGKPLFGREWPCHFTASAWVVDPTRTKTLMVYHNLYRSWSWIGGHADGDECLARVAARELEEETGVANAKLAQPGLFSCEVLTVEGHVKRGAWVESHLHLNATYLFEADSRDPLRIAPDENSGVKWLTFEEALEASSEPWMVQHVYRKLIERSR